MEETDNLIDLQKTKQSKTVETKNLLSEDDDFKLQDSSSRKLSTFETVLTLVSCCIGGEVVSIPNCYL
jgi:hypothetical protein